MAWQLTPGDSVRERKTGNMGYVVSVREFSVRVRWIRDNSESDTTATELEKITS